MWPISGLFFVVALLSSSSGENLVRKKRFFDSFLSNLWPSEEVKGDVQNGLIYAQLPPEYLHLLPGVNDHRTIQRRSGQQPARFVHPTRMASLPQPHYQPKPNMAQPMKLTPPVTPQLCQQTGPKVFMKPVRTQNAKLCPTITLKTKDQALPDIHKIHRFIPVIPVPNANQKPLIQPFNTQQQLPIKRSFDIAPTVISSKPQLSVKTAHINDFYYTTEFQDLLAAFGINADVSKLPAIHDVMAILGTENAEDTLNAIRDITQSAEGMELIRAYLDQNQVNDEIYNYDDDVGTGEIQVEGSEDAKHIQHQQPTYSQVQAPHINEQITIFPTRATTTGTLTGGGQSWWRPTTWFNSGPSTKLDSLQKDAEIAKNIVPKPSSPWEGVNYIGRFLTPASSESIPINPSMNFQPDPRRTVLQQPLRFAHQSVIEDTRTLPTIQMSEAQFQDMVKTLKLTPVNMPLMQNTQSGNIMLVQRKKPIVTQAPLEKFEAPINVQSVSTGISHQSLPLPSTYTQFEESEPQATAELSDQKNRRNFVSASEPQRSAPFDFIAAGRIHKANPEEVIKKSRSLAETIEDERQVIASISELTSHHENF